MAQDQAKPFAALILDAGPIIKNTPSVSTLLAKSQKLVTLPSVVAEFRDEQTRIRVESTLKPFLLIRDPRPESVKHVADFARRTGDYAVLSGTDLKVAALAYELHNEQNHIIAQRLGEASFSSLEETGSLCTQLSTASQQNQRCNTVPKPILGRSVSDSKQGDASAVGLDQPQTPNAHGGYADALRSTQDGNQTASSPSHASLATEVAGDVADLGEISLQDEHHDWHSSVVNPPPAHVHGETSDGSSTDGAEDEDWITPSNINRRMAEETAPSLASSSVSPDPVPVATLTTDFALQNVLLQLQLNILSTTTLQHIQQLRTTILRCHGCFQLVKDTTKQFCPRCGQPNLTRVPASIDRVGKMQVHLKQNWEWNRRGQRYSIPKPVMGTPSGRNVKGGGKGGWGNDLILTEDQKEYTRAVAPGSRARRKEKDLMDEDVLPGILSGDRSRVGGAQPTVGAGRNVNSKRRSKKR
ncbi:MAG: hypothetical protein Q9162_004349 [Coniocarpon cinnabarinum]